VRLYELKNKRVLKFKNNAAEFIKQFSTNVAEVFHGAFIDVRGKIVVLFQQKKVSNDEIWVVIEKQFFERLRKHLEKYLALSDTVLEIQDAKVYFDIEGDYPVSVDETAIPEDKGQWIVSRETRVSSVTDEEFTLFRVKNNLPVQGIDFDEEMLLNVADEKFVSYTKGCYLGQEIIARVHSRLRPPKKLVVMDEDKVDAGSLTSPVKDPETGKIIGFIFVNMLQSFPEGK